MRKLRTMRRPASCATGRLECSRRFELQQQLVAQRKAGEIPDQLLIVEHPHVITLGRNGHEENLLASAESC